MKRIHSLTVVRMIDIGGLDGCTKAVAEGSKVLGDDGDVVVARNHIRRSHIHHAKAPEPCQYMSGGDEGG